MGFVFEDWMVAIAALIFGVGLGWLVWGGRKGEGAAKSASADAMPPAAAAIANDAAAPSNAVNAPPAESLDAVERELKVARELLDEGEEEMRLFGEEIADLDSAIKRANGRLRLLIKEIRRRALGSPADDDA